LASPWNLGKAEHEHIDIVSCHGKGGRNVSGKEGFVKALHYLNIILIAHNPSLQLGNSLARG